MQSINKASTSDLEAFQEVVRIIEKLPDQELFLNTTEIIVNFVDPETNEQSMKEE